MAKKKTERSFQTEVLESAHKIWLAGLGALAVAEEEGTKAFKTLVDKGEEFETKGIQSIKRVADDVTGMTDKAKASVEAAVKKAGGSFDEKVAEALQRLGVPSRDEIAQLTKRVEDLTASVEKLRESKAT
jgi:poly(hydroxyalkanoate) granule-associated protein